MTNKRMVKATIAQLTENGAFIYPWVTKETLKVAFSSTFSTCYYGERVLKKIKGGQGGGNYRGIDDYEIYRVWQDKT